MQVSAGPQYGMLLEAVGEGDRLVDCCRVAASSCGLANNFVGAQAYGGRSVGPILSACSLRCS